MCGRGKDLPACSSHSAPYLRSDGGGERRGRWFAGMRTKMSGGRGAWGRDVKINQRRRGDICLMTVCYAAALEIKRPADARWGIVPRLCEPPQNKKTNDKKKRDGVPCLVCPSGMWCTVFLKREFTCIRTLKQLMHPAGGGGGCESFCVGLRGLSSRLSHDLLKSPFRHLRALQNLKRPLIHLSLALK